MIARPSVEDPFDIVVGKLRNGQQRGDGVRATCPAHDDGKPSLDVDRGDDGKVLLCCRAGCSTEAIVEKLGLSLTDLFPAGDGRPAKAPKPAKEPKRYPSAEAVAEFYQRQFGGELTTFTYADGAGAVVGKVLRFDITNDDGSREKRIRQARPVDGGRAWIAEGPGAPVPIYQLPALLAAQPDEPVLVVEGEGKVHELQGLGFVATCSMRGANGFAKSDWAPLAGRHIVILPDNDKPGADYRDGVAKLAHEGGTASVSTLDLPGLGDGGDVVDWAAARRAEGRTNDEIAAELRNLVALAKPDSAKCAATPKAARRPTVPWPDPIGRVARIGVLGELLDAVDLQTEADPAAIAFDFLARLGNAVNRGPHFQIEADRHACNLFVAVVGDTGQGRKGTSAGYPRAVMGVADPIWTEQCCRGGLSSGEGVIWAVRDPMQVGSDRKTGEPILDPGVTDKRVLLFEPELARTLRAAGRRDSTLSTILRQAWEGSPLASMTKAPYRATGAHVSLIAHVTPTELASLLQQDDVAGGTVNRFLFVCSRRQRELPYGGQVGQVVIETIGQHVAECIEIARKHASVFPFDPEANQAWPDHYHALLADEKAHGLKGQVLGRAVAQTRRLAMLLAICDGCVEVTLRHVRGAVELWRYSRDSALRVFGDSTGNRLADRILGELRGLADAADDDREGLSRTAIYKLFDRHVTKDEINEALDLLVDMRLAAPTRVATSGRTAEIWNVA